MQRVYSVLENSCIIKNLYCGIPRCGHCFHYQFSIDKTIKKKSKRTKTNNFVLELFLAVRTREKKLFFSFIGFRFYLAVNQGGGGALNSIPECIII